MTAITKRKCAVCGGTPFSASLDPNEAVFCSLECRQKDRRKMSRDLDTPAIRAFDRGLSAARSGKDRSANPYMPSTEEELWQSWNCGFDVENGPRYRVVSAEYTTLKVAR